METTQKVAELKKVLPSQDAPPSLSPNRFTRDSAYSLRVSYIRVPAGVKFSDVLRPEFWAHIAAQLVPSQIIVVHTDDNSYRAQLTVLKCTRLEAVVSADWFREETPDALPEAADPADAYVVKWAGPTAKWRVSRISDNATVSEGHASKEIAQAELKSHLTAMAA